MRINSLGDGVKSKEKEGRKEDVDELLLGRRACNENEISLVFISLSKLTPTKATAAAIHT